MARIKQQILAEAELTKRHSERRMIRFWHRLGRVVLALTLLPAILVALGGVVLVGTLTFGLRELAQWVGAYMPPQPAVVPLLASWSLLMFGLMLLTALRVRRYPISLKYQPWAVHLPIEDQRLIGAGRSTLLFILIPAVVYSVTVFGLGGYLLDWPWTVFARLAIVVGVSIVMCWILAQLIAVYLPLTPLVDSTMLTILGCLLVMALTIGAVPRSTPEILDAGSYGPVWSLPPGGWLLGISGILSVDPIHRILLPLAALILCTLGWLRLRPTFQLVDIQIPSSGRATAYRQSWLRTWKRPQILGRVVKFADDPKRIARFLAQRRELVMGASQNGLRRTLVPFPMGRKHYSVLGLLGIRYARLGRLSECLWGLWPIPMALGFLILNQSTPLAGIPRYLRVPLVFTFAMSLFDFREFFSSVDKQDTNLGYSAARSIFPITVWQVLNAFAVNRLMMIWMALPGWIAAIAILSVTDIPIQMVLHTPAIVAALSMTIPLLGVLSYASGNLRSSWQTWVYCVIPICAFVIAYVVAGQIGVIGYLLAMRVDLSWLWLCVSAGGLLLVTIIYCRLFQRGKFDETVFQLSRTVKRR